MEKFSYENNGYNRKEVNSFISEVIEETRSLITRVKQQQVEINELKRELDYYKNLNYSFNDIIQRINESNESLKKSLTEEKNVIIDQAKNNASKIVNEALLKATKLEEERKFLEKNIESLKRNLKYIIEQQTHILEDIDIE